MIIACDFDGTIVEHKFPAIGPEVPGAIDALKDLQTAGNKIILWTCRNGYELAEALEWLKERGFTADAVNTNLGKRDAYAVPKIYADFYIDDRNLPAFPGWDYVRRVFGLSGAHERFEAPAGGPEAPETPPEGQEGQEKALGAPEEQEGPQG